MIIPIRCTSCGKVIAHLWEDYANKLQQEYNQKVPLSDLKQIKDIQDSDESVEKKLLDEMGLHRYCCRRMILSHVDMSDKL